MGQKATIDRIEGELAVLITDAGPVHRRRSELSPDAREGDVVDLETGELDREATEQLRKEVQRARERARRRPGPGGSFDL